MDMMPRILCTTLAMLQLLVLAVAQDSSNPMDDETKAKIFKPQIQYLYHKVKEGETVYGIAKLYHADIEDIFKLNPGSEEVIWTDATLLIPCQMVGGEVENYEADSLMIMSHINNYIAELDVIAGTVVENLDDVKEMSKRYSQLETKWNVYSQAKQADIANSESLMEYIMVVEQHKQVTKDSLDAAQNRFEQLLQFDKAEMFISSQLEQYEQLSKQAVELSLVEKMAPLLEAMKTKEQLLFAEIETNYTLAKDAAAIDNTLDSRMEHLTEDYVKLKNKSEGIQAAQYKSFFDRIKEYLYGLAAVALILMFVNMVQSKIKAFKAARDAAKKLEKFRKQNDNEYPSI